MATTSGQGTVRASPAKSRVAQRNQQIMANARIPLMVKLYRPPGSLSPPARIPN